jgi:hypothetical protein
MMAYKGFSGAGSLGEAPSLGDNGAATLVASSPEPQPLAAKSSPSRAPLQA